MATTTVGRMMFEDAIPARFRVGMEDGPVGSKEIGKILSDVADKEPGAYKDVSFALLGLGTKGSVETNTSFTLDDLKSPIDKEKVIREMRAKEAPILADKTIDRTERDKRLTDLYQDVALSLPDQIFNAAMGKGSNLARMVASGARGNKSQLNSNIGADMLVSDSKGRPVLVPITHNYAEGLSPAEFFGASFGTRLGLISTKACCSGSTEVRMADGSVKEIQNISPGDRVMGAYINGNPVPVTVLNRFDNGPRFCRRHKFRIYKSKGFAEFVATDDHKILTRRKPRGKSPKGPRKYYCPEIVPVGKAMSAGIGLFGALPVQGGLECGTKSEPYALLIGLLLGDGYYASNQQLVLSCADPVMVDDLEEPLKKINFCLKKTETDYVNHSYRLNYIDPPPKIGGGRASVSGCPFRAKINNWGWRGKKAPQKAFPEEIYTWDNDSVAKALGGLFSADGSIFFGRNHGMMKMALTSLKMLEQVRDLLSSRFGILVPPILKVNVSKKKWAKNPQWVLSFSHADSIRHFFETIPLVGKKRFQAEEVLRRANKAPHLKENNRFVWAGSEEVGLIDTFDLEVDHPDHLFVLANGLIVSNSVQDSGFFAKQLSAAAADLLITTQDCKTSNGLATDPGDTANVGALLARPAGGYPANTVITPKIAAELGRNIPKGQKIVVRSPLACMARQGLCAKCAGVRERGHLPHLSENLGLAAASGVSEPVTQSMLCLAGWTRVLMADGTTRSIQKIIPGEMVMGSDIRGNPFPSKVLNRYDNGERECWKVGFKVGDGPLLFIDSTLDHKVLTLSGEKTPLGDLPGPVRVLAHEEGAIHINQAALGKIDTFDLEVDHPDHLFILANGLIVSNSTKHSAGVASAGGGSNVTGFPAVNVLSQIPRIYPGGAILSENDGRVRKVEKAPQGGYNVTVGDWTGHIPPGRDVAVKEGDTLEAGDTVSTGVPSPAEIVRLKGVGAGRKYWVDAMTKNLAASGTRIDRRNLEVMARAVINHVEAGEDVDTSRHLPGDILEYGAWQAGYRKASDTRKLHPSESVGRFLQSPALHYTIGTRITPSVAEELGSAGMEKVESSEGEPDFKPHMIRLMDSPAYKDDWVTHTGQSYAKRNLKRDIQEGGASSLLHGPHMGLSLARGIEFGRPGKGEIGY